MNYDAFLWDRIRTELTNNHQNIDVLNRAQIVDDVFSLARAGEMNYSEAFNLMNYLYNETEYFPWYSALNGFDYLLRVYGESSDLGSQLIDFEYYLLQNVQNVIPFAAPDADNQILTLRSNLILNRLCRIGRTDYVTEAQRLYQGYKNGIR